MVTTNIQSQRKEWSSVWKHQIQPVTRLTQGKTKLLSAYGDGIVHITNDMIKVILILLKVNGTDTQAYTSHSRTPLNSTYKLYAKVRDLEVSCNLQ